MRVTKVSTTLMVMLLVASMCLASGGSGSSEALLDPCSDPWDLNPADPRHESILNYCQVVEEHDPIGQGQLPPDSPGSILQYTERVLDWLSSLGFLMPMIGT